MASGRLDAGGVGALRALKHLMTAKAVDYDFQYYFLPQPADAPVTVGVYTIGFSQGWDLGAHAVH